MDANITPRGDEVATPGPSGQTPARFFGPAGEIDIGTRPVGVAMLLMFVLMPIGGLAPGVLMDLPAQSEESLVWFAAGAATGLLLALALPTIWYDVLFYKSFWDPQIRELAARLAHDRLFSRRAGRRRLKTLGRLDRQARKAEKALTDLAEARGALAASTAPEPRLLAEMDERAALLRRQREEILEQARAYTAQERRNVYGGPDTVRRRQDQAALDHAMRALESARKAEQG